MNRCLIACALTAVLGLAATPAAAADAVKMLQDLCIAPVSTSDAEIAQARAAGFVAAPEMFTRSMPVQFAKDAVVMWRVFDRGADMLLVGRLNPANSPLGPEIDGNFCAVITTPAQGDPTPSLQAVLGVAPTEAAGQMMFVYKDEQGKHVPVDATKTLSLVRLVEAGNLRVALAMNPKTGLDQMTVALVLIPVAKKVALNEAPPAQ